LKQKIAALELKCSKNVNDVNSKFPFKRSELGNFKIDA
jgi:hypothetical protein